jgi:membrane protein
MAAALWRNLPFLLRRAVVSSAEDGVFSLAKGAAYSSLLSFFPILTSAAAILVQVRAEFVAQQIAGFLSEVLPPGTDQVVMMQFRLRGPKPVGLLIAANILSIWAASSIIKSLIDGFHMAYRVPKGRDFFHNTAVAMALVLAGVLPFAAASALLIFGEQAESVVLNWFKVDPLLNPLAAVWEALYRFARFVVASAAMIWLSTIVYYFAPYRKQKFRMVLPGAVLATILWVGATLGFSWYVRNVSNYNVLYGSIGTGIALLVWMYLLSAIAMLGCEFNAEYERMLALETK